MDDLHRRAARILSGGGETESTGTRKKSRILTSALCACLVLNREPPPGTGVVSAFAGAACALAQAAAAAGIVRAEAPPAPGRAGIGYARPGAERDGLAFAARR